MACFSPLDAWQTDGGDITFVERGSIRRALQLPCGQCIGCRLERSRQWAVRCMHEAQLHENNCFLTLTYDEDNCPISLNYRHFQLFMKKARKKFGPFRFYMCGEYGETYQRPHFHACLFGFRPSDLTYWRKSAAGFRLYRSADIESVWSHGFVEIGDVTFESAAYVARYIVKKVTGFRARDHYECVDGDTGEIVDRVPEFTRMSLKPGIGADWIRLYRNDVYKSEGESYVVVNGMKCKPPRYYDQYMENTFQFEEVQFRRYKDMLLRIDDNTPDRLEVREKVTRARLSFKQRNLE